MFGKGLSLPFFFNSSAILSISQSLILSHIFFTFSDLTEFITVFFSASLDNSFFSSGILSILLLTCSLLLLILFFILFLFGFFNLGVLNLFSFTFSLIFRSFKTLIFSSFNFLFSFFFFILFSFF